MRTVIKKGNIPVNNDIPNEILNKDTYVKNVQTTRTRTLRQTKNSNSEILLPKKKNYKNKDY
jgi:hypothetical protein